MFVFFFQQKMSFLEFQKIAAERRRKRDREMRRSFKKQEHSITRQSPKSGLLEKDQHCS